MKYIKYCDIPTLQRHRQLHVRSHKQLKTGNSPTDGRAGLVPLYQRPSMQVIRKKVVITRKAVPTPPHRPVSTVGREEALNSGWPSLKGHWMSSPRLLKQVRLEKAGGKGSTIATKLDPRGKEGIGRSLPARPRPTHYTQHFGNIMGAIVNTICYERRG